MFNVSGERESNTKKSKTIYFQLITLIISDVVSEKGNNSKGSSLLIINTLAGYLYLLRRGRDSNPRYPFEVYTLSRRALSTTQTPLLFAPANVIQILRVGFKNCEPNDIRYSML